MDLSGNLAEFSLPEIFQFLEQGNKKGLLTIRVLSASKQKEQVHYLWLLYGRIVAAADRLDNKGLISMICKRNWLSDNIASKISVICPINTPLGICLKSQGILQSEQLQLLFRVQILRQLTALFQIKDGQFEFDPKASLPQQEITGLSISATEATLIGLRTLQDWTALAEKLPDPYSGIVSATTDKPQLPLDSLELQVWELANGEISLKEIAKQLGISIEKVQQVVFRLIVTNLAEEIFILTKPTTVVAESRLGGENLLEPNLEPVSKPSANNSKSNVSQSFLQNLVGFLKGKA